MVLKRQSERKWKPRHDKFSEDSDPLVRTESGKGVQSGSQGCNSPSWILWIDKGRLHFDIYQEKVWTYDACSLARPGYKDKAQLKASEMQLSGYFFITVFPPPASAGFLC